MYFINKVFDIGIRYVFVYNRKIRRLPMALYKTMADSLEIKYK